MITWKKLDEWRDRFHIKKGEKGLVPELMDSLEEAWGKIYDLEHAEEYKQYTCSTWKCKRPVVSYERGDHWCAVDLKRVRKLWADEFR